MPKKLTCDTVDDESPPIQPPTRQHSVASRISLDESRLSTPPIPPGFEAHIGNESRRSTPTVPPGFSKPTALPDLEGSLSRPSSRPSSRASVRRQTSQIQPVLPLRPATPARVLTPSRLDPKDDTRKDAVQETPTKASRSHASSELKAAISATEDLLIPENENSTPASSAAPNITAKPAEGNAVDQIDAPSKASLSPKKAKTLPAALPSAAKPPAAVEARDVKAVPVVASKIDVPKPETQKRKHPGKLNITTTVSKQEQSGASVSTPVDDDTLSKSQRTILDLSQTPSSARPLDSPNVASPAFKNAAPRTLRVVQTPKAETPPPTAASSIPAAFAHRLPSRQPSVASINFPGTPSSEQVSMSDNISMTSTSLSRANSPPPAGSKVGSAPVRAKTKSQQKKDRQERAKVLEEEKAKPEEGSKASVEPVVEAIVSRKKKAKKEKEPKPPRTKPIPAPATTTVNTTPTASRPVSPGAKASVETSASSKADLLLDRDSKPATPVKSTPPPAQPANPSPPATPTVTPAQLIAELKASAPEIQKCIDSLFRVSNSHHFKTQHNISQKDLLAHFKADFKYTPTKEEVEALLKGRIPAVHYGCEDGRIIDRGMVTPTGAHLRALTKELETRFLELEKALREMPEELRFRPSKPQNEVKFEKFDLEALKRQYENGARGASVMEQMVQDGSTMKKGAFLVDEASKYINEFVMPPVTPPPSVGTQARVAHGQAFGGAQAQAGEQAVPSVEIAERHLNESKRMSDEKESSLKKLIKKNKKTLGLA